MHAGRSILVVRYIIELHLLEISCENKDLSSLFQYCESYQHIFVCGSSTIASVL